MAVLKRNGYTYGGALNIDAKAGAHINEHGTPSVEANFENGKMIFTFDYLKGAEGEPGGLPDDNITGAGSVGEFAIFNGKNVIGSRSLTPTDVGLSQVGNFKAVSTEANQGLTTTEKSNARANIGAGTSNFDGNYNNLSNKPSLATVATSGNYNDLTNKPSFGTAASKNYTNSYSSTGTDLVTGQAVSAALATLPSPMIFKGSLGSGGTISSLPTASNANIGYTYKGSNSILDFFDDFNEKYEFEDEEDEFMKHEYLNMTIYAFYNLLDFLKEVSSTDYKPLEEDWITLRDNVARLVLG